MSGPLKSHRGGRITDVLHEALDVLATPTVRDTTIQRALAVAGYEKIPERGADVRRFVDEFLRVAVISTLGEDAAAHVCTSLEPIVRMAETQFNVSEVRPRAAPATMAPAPITEPPAPTIEPPAPTIEPPALTSEPPAATIEPPAPTVEPPALTLELPASEASSGPVILCSPLSFVAKALGNAIGGGAHVTHASDELGLIEALEDEGQPTPTVVILDCRTAPVDVATLAAVIAEKVPVPLLVLWGATEAIQEEVSLAADGLHSVPVPGDCDVHELATRCTPET